MPSLITVRNMMASRPPESLFQGDELPIEVDVPNHVHSVFACPILKARLVISFVFFFIIFDSCCKVDFSVASFAKLTGFLGMNTHSDFE